MRKICHILFIAFITVNVAICQDRDKVDSLLKVLPGASIEEKSNIYLEISDNYLSLNPDSSVLFGLKALQLAEQSKDDRLIAISKLGLGYAYYYTDSLELSEKYLLEAIPVFKESSDTTNLFNLYNYLTYVYFETFNYNEALKYQNLSIEIETGIADKEETASRLSEFGLVYEYTGKIEKAQAYYIQSLKLYRELDDKERIADLLNNLGNIYQTLNNYEKALECYIESRNIQSDIQNLAGIAIADNNIGIVYHDWGQYDKALEFYRKGLETEQMMESEMGISESLLNIAVVYHDMKDFKMARDYYNRAMEIAEEIKNKSLLAIIYTNIADLYYQKKQYDSAIISEKKSLSYYEEMGNEVGVGESHLMYGQIYMEMKEYQKAQDHFLLGISILEPKNILLSTADCYKGLAEVYAAMSKYKLAYEYFNKYHIINDSIFSESMAKKLNLLEIENREQEIKLINEEREREQLESDLYSKRIKIQTVVVIVLVTGLVVILSLVGILLYQLKSKRNAFLTLKKQHEEIKINKKELEVAKEQADESNRLKSAFLVNLSHEIRTPMNGIIGFSQILKEKGISPDEMSSYAEQIYENSLKLLNLLNNIIDISSIQTGQLTLSKENIILSGLINDIFTQYKLNPEFQKPDIEFELDCKCPDELTITGDSQRLYQVLENVIDNAFKYTERGKIIISCDVIEDIAEVRVTDTGIGIPEDKLSFIFDKFTQLDYSSTRKYEGTGIGLALSKSLIELMNGSIKAESELHKGSTFIISFPVK